MRPDRRARPDEPRGDVGEGLVHLLVRRPACVGERRRATGTSGRAATACRCRSRCSSRGTRTPCSRPTRADAGSPLVDDAALDAARVLGDACGRSSRATCPPRARSAGSSAETRPPTFFLRSPSSPSTCRKSGRRFETTRRSRSTATSTAARLIDLARKHDRERRVARAHAADPAEDRADLVRVRRAPSARRCVAARRCGRRPARPSRRAPGTCARR